MTISHDTFTFVADLVRRRSAILLEPGKEYLVESRLLPLAREAGASGVDQFVAQLRANPSPARTAVVVEALTTNETSWFRDVAPFDALRRHIVPELRAGGLGRLRVWSAACSTGQEAYSIAMTLQEVLVPTVAVEITATDLNEQVLERARSGTYTQLEVNRGLPAPTLVRHFQRHGSGWQVSDELRRWITFRQHNLLDVPPPGGPFDVVFLRNVLIYFDLPTKRAVLERVRAALRPGGYLVLGAAETTIGVHDDYERVVLDRATVYRTAGGRAAAAAPAAAPTTAATATAASLAAARSTLAGVPARPAPAAVPPRPVLPTPARPAGSVFAPTSTRGAGLT
ncbi:MULTISPECIES: CheR family methyltransferase [unclassified Cellulomonas]|uniref:CheR family methyltransferase n=1 Tax=unclassified Cellulomonas TaxID=2620175 RepID=UPI0009E5A6FB|nr:MULTISPECIES: protein-glutamate O-methyltransferase CheR [unclassified Cellulomonas]TFH70705.1 protein-glutamate O-methyltransferase CheR [Cellulomonas sp. HD19AZ1]